MLNKLYGLVQYQADGANGGGTNPGTTPPAGGTAAQDVNGGNPTPPATGKATEQPKNLDELLKDEALKGELDKRIADAIAGSKKQWDADAAEKERLAKLSDEDRTKEERATFERDKQVFTATQQLADAKLPVEFAKILAGKDAAETAANINSFSAAFKAAVEVGVVERLKGTPPQAGAKPSDQATADAKYKNNPYYGKSI